MPVCETRFHRVIEKFNLTVESKLHPSGLASSLSVTGIPSAVT